MKWHQNINRERLDTLARWLEAGAPHDKLVFDMAVGIVYRIPLEEDEKENLCQTSCCLAGAAVEFFDPSTDDERMEVAEYLEADQHCELYQMMWSDVRHRANELLFGPEPDIDPNDGDEYDSYISTIDKLFVPSARFGGDLGDYNDPAWAARTLRRFMDTLEVDWRATAQTDKQRMVVRDNW